jgi:hypothetical protein
VLISYLLSRALGVIRCLFLKRNSQRASIPPATDGDEVRASVRVPAISCGAIGSYLRHGHTTKAHVPGQSRVLTETYGNTRHNSFILPCV